jgi:hypothetical protein
LTETAEKPKKEVLQKLQRIHQTPREWELVENNPEKILELIQNNLLFKDPSIKNFIGKTTVQIKPFSNKNSFLIETSADSTLSEEREITVFKFTKEQYFEIIFERYNSKGNSHQVQIKQARIAKRKRRLDRIVIKDIPVNANNFQVTKIDLDIHSALGFSVEVIFNEIDKTLKQKYPRSKVIPLFNRNDMSEEETIVLNTKLPIFVTNALRMISSTDVKCYNIKEFYDEEFILDEKITKFRKESIFSFLYFPIIFKTDKEDVVIGYCYNEGTSEISAGNLEYFSVIAETIIKRIMDSSTATIEEKQSVINISEHGVLMQVNSAYIRDALKVKPNFSMDLIFKMMTPMRFSLLMKHMYSVESKTYIGAEITGSNNDDRGMDKYRETVRGLSSKK